MTHPCLSMQLHQAAPSSMTGQMVVAADVE